MKFSICVFYSFIIISFVGCALPSTKNMRKQEGLKSSLKQRQVCLERIKYYQLLSRLSEKEKKFSFLSKKTKFELCSKYFRATTTFINEHEGRIGVIYFQGLKDKDKNESIIAGIIKSAGSINAKKKFVFKKVKLTKRSINHAMGELILKEKVGVIITWGKEGLVRRVQRWQKGLGITTLFIHHNISKSGNSFRVVPNRKNYGKKLVKEMENKKIKRIAILAPVQSNRSALLKTIKESFKDSKIEIVYDLKYDPSNYNSMNQACKKIFKIDRFKRGLEFRTILNRQRKQSKEDGFKLNQKLVFLSAQVDFDAIFIPDNFKIVNHFIRLFEYYKAPKVPLIGTYEWRSKELLSLNAKYLSGSVFVDFIGELNTLPIFSKKERLKIKSQENPGSTIDYKLMGYYTGLVSQRAISHSDSQRARIAKGLKQMRINDSFIENKKAFRSNEFNWPTFAFQVSTEGFYINTKINKK